MRNPDRIKPFCNELAKVWEEYFPDWRFGQLMMNFLGYVAVRIDPFFSEEDKMLEFLHNYVKELCGNETDENETEAQ